LQWSDAPGGTQSFVLLCDDPDALAAHGTTGRPTIFRRTVTELAVGAAQNKNIKQAVNDFRKMGYGGPCPPHGHEPHHYHFRLLALSTDHLSAKTNSSCPEVEREARKYAIAEATLVGWYER
jgi:Raf kinase inhibitor-like YbhB/YbcL family protein